jgi:hypothetical protein
MIAPRFVARGSGGMRSTIVPCRLPSGLFTMASPQAAFPRAQNPFNFMQINNLHQLVPAKI